MKIRAFLPILAFLLLLTSGSAAADIGPEDPGCYFVEVDDPNGGTPMGASICP